MRTALIADIHGNLVALRAVVADLTARGADRIVCLGDVAATGPQPAEAIEAVGQLGCEVVMGNTDEWLLEPTEETIEDDDTRRIAEIDLWARDQLTSEHLAMLGGYRARVELDGMLCYHGSPRSNMDALLPTTPDGELAQLLAGYAHPVMAGAHTHIAMLRRFRESIVINPGSVGLPFEQVAGGAFRNPPWAEYAIVDGSQVEFHRVPLDVGAVTEAALASGMPNAGWWVKDWAWS
ncbi:MAG TPA: metallophosphoesterase family protein [Gaiellales bacterium]|nr:metallophosphoesterase family protein [Gaiellales bacterium]